MGSVLKKGCILILVMALWGCGSLATSTTLAASRKNRQTVREGEAIGIDYGFPRGTCDRWAELYALRPDNAALNYQMGICRESEGEYEEAFRYYNETVRLGHFPDERLEEALARIRMKIDSGGNPPKGLQVQ